MLSSVKNFFLTFLISLLIFGAVASLAVNIITKNINGSLDFGNDEKDKSSETDESGEYIKKESQGSSLNILLIGTDFRPSILGDYNPAFLEDGEEDTDDVLAPTDLAKPGHVGKVLSDKDVEESEAIRVDDDTLIIKDGFYSISYRPVETDAVILIRLDKERGQITYTSFPVEAYTVVGGKNIKLSEIYDKYGMDILMDKIHAMTGITIDRYATVSMENFPAIIDAVGGVEFNVPCNMKYDDNAGNVHISLTAGYQLLDGNQALQALMFNGYTDGINSRIRTTVSFFRSFLTSLTDIDTVSKLTDVWEKIEGMYSTDLTADDFVSNAPLLLKYSSNQIEVNVVTTTKDIIGVNYTFIDDTATATVFQSFKRIYNN